jgi:import inner membrane translocase subunit TIM44
MAAFADTYANSDNAFVATARGFTSTVGRLFDETEQAKVIRWAKELDPEFQMETFLRDLRDYVVPEVVDAFVSGDSKTLREWCSEGVGVLLPSPNLVL